MQWEKMVHLGQSQHPTVTIWSIWSILYTFNSNKAFSASLLPLFCLSLPIFVPLPCLSTRPFTTFRGFKANTGFAPNPFQTMVQTNGHHSEPKHNLFCIQTNSEVHLNSLRAFSELKLRHKHSISKLQIKFSSAQSI